MAKIKSIYDALIKTHMPEDKCTNFLVWLLKNIPCCVLSRICKESGLSLTLGEGDDFGVSVQYTLQSSRPDAIFEISNGDHLILETKRFPNRFDKKQFLNHYVGGKEEFGAENVYILFLSGDQSIPVELKDEQASAPGEIGFISWNKLLQILNEEKEIIDDKYEIIIKEFISFANHYKLGRLIDMNNEDVRKFIDVYPFVALNQEAVRDKLTNIIKNIEGRIILGANELAEECPDDLQEELPCIYKCLKLRGWHTINSAYISINMLLKKMAVVLTGYQDNAEKKLFLAKWKDDFKYKYKEDPKLISLTWIDEGNDAAAVNGGYFKIIEGSSGKMFDPDKISEAEDCFYWGYLYDLDIDNIQSYYDKIANDFKSLLDRFLVGKGVLRRPSKKK